MFVGNSKVSTANTPNQAKSQAAHYLGRNPNASIRVREHKVTKESRTLYSVSIRPIGKKTITA